MIPRIVTRGASVFLVIGFFFKDGGCYGSLSITKSAIAGTHLPVLKHSKPRFFKIFMIA